LIGDKVYGLNSGILDLYRSEGNTERVKILAGFPRHALHAWKLSLSHPITRRDLELVCPPPEDFVMLCRQNELADGLPTL